MSDIIELTRFAYSPDGTFGRLVLPNGWGCFTVEKPWNNNEIRKSCIPDGSYQLKMRRSAVVERTSKGKYKEGWEVTNVPNRTYIMIHVANWSQDVVGCIGVGDSYTVLAGSNAVGNSGNTFDTLMKQLSENTEWDLLIKPFIMEYP